ncbi:unnamed protein product [Pseudo-nitzschia multistriata]|uniref:Uncharacterized protein n=1 Tax=Pseudo-nitzschia multistriata TaxID=183589 RepID=A0A448Z0A5_9STRA|nr:unnamed protein product [Pseudo-nitzschia multistriata]
MGISSASLDNDHRMIATAFMLRIGGAVAGQSQAVRILTLPRCGPSPGTTPGMLIMGSHRRSLASSSSGSNGSEPRLSRRNKVDLLALAMGICGGVGYYYLSESGETWEERVRRTKHRLVVSVLELETKQATTRYQTQGVLFDKKRAVNEYECTPRIRNLDQRLTNGPFSENSQEAYSNRPPPAVRRYIADTMTASSESNGNILGGRDPWFLYPKAVASIYQKGEFYAANQWYPFEATMIASTSLECPGFVWDARTTILAIPHNVLEYYIPHGSDGGKMITHVGEGKTVTRACGKYPLIQFEEDDPYLFFWLAMTPMFPGVFLSQHGDCRTASTNLLEWSNLDNKFGSQDYASGKLLCDDGERCLVEFFFNEEQGMFLLERIQVASRTGDIWQASYRDYRKFEVGTESAAPKENNQRSKNHRAKIPIESDSLGTSGGSILLRLPSKIEIGKGQGDKYRSHLKMKNRHLEYSTP